MTKKNAEGKAKKPEELKVKASEAQSFKQNQVASDNPITNNPKRGSYIFKFSSSFS